MTVPQADQFAWDLAATVVTFLGVVAVVLLGFALLREISR